MERSNVRRKTVKLLEPQVDVGHRSDSSNSPVEPRPVGSTVGDLPLKAFGLSRNPFCFETALSQPNLVSSCSSQALSALADWVCSQRPRERAVLVGTEGAGRTTILHALVDCREIVSAGFHATFFDAGIGNGYRPEGTVESYQARLLKDLTRKTRDKARKILVLDNADWLIGRREDGGQSSSLAGGMSCAVLGISYSTFHSIVQNAVLPREAKTIFVSPFEDKSEIERKLRSAVRACSEKGDPFEAGAYAEVSAMSMGLPGLASDLAHASLWTAGWVGAEQVTKVIVDKVAGTLYYDVANDLLSKPARLWGLRRDVVFEAVRRYYVQGEVRRNALCKAFGRISSSTVNHHLMRLVDERLFVEERYGRRIKYEVPKPVRAAVQLIQAARPNSNRARRNSDSFSNATGATASHEDGLEPVSICPS